MFLSLSVNVQAQGEIPAQSSSTTITTQVPETHEAVLTITGEGVVSVNGQTYSDTGTSIEIQIPRLENIAWRFSPAGGYILKQVLYNGIDVTKELVDSIYMAQPVNEDGTEVRVVFIKDGTGSEAEGDSSGQQSEGSNVSSPGTGDNTSVRFWTGALSLSLLLMLSCVVTIKKRRA